MLVLEKVRDFALKAHGDQRRKFEDQPYIIHLDRVKEICAAYTQDMPVLAAALLHDVLEDTPVSKKELNEFLHSAMGSAETDRTMAMVVDLTDVFIKSNYPSWNRRKRKTKEAERLADASPDAQTIKYADITDNSMSIMGAEDFVEVYLRECKRLLAVMTKGNLQLRERAIQTVERCLKQNSS